MDQICPSYLWRCIEVSKMIFFCCCCWRREVAHREPKSKPMNESKKKYDKNKTDFLCSSMFLLEHSMPVCVSECESVCVQLYSRDYNLSELPNEAEFQVCAFALKRTNNAAKRTQRRSIAQKRNGLQTESAWHATQKDVMNDDRLLLRRKSSRCFLSFFRHHIEFYMKRNDFRFCLVWFGSVRISTT